jgi:VacB/RNase II family 3'-5' exoribonuclease
VTRVLEGQQSHRAILRRIAERAMIERGLLPTFAPEIFEELKSLDGLPAAAGRGDGDAAGIRDLTALPWASIDNDDSRDLDQLTVSEPATGGDVTIRVAVADVDALVKDGSAVDAHARHNTTSVYTAAEIFPMLPERLSTDRTSLNPGEDRLAVVVEMLVAEDGTARTSDVYRARVRNQAQLTYKGVATWLTGSGETPAAIRAVPGLADTLRVQDRVAQRLRRQREAHGALRFETPRAKPVFTGDSLDELEVEQANRAKDLIEDFMIAANGMTARFLEAKRFPSIRRVVRTPKRWDRIVVLAREHGFTLPGAADPVALDAFLDHARAADPLRFADVSLAVIKLLGAGEYVAEQPGTDPPGHFGLAVRDYAHSTAPNRRYPDLITQRLLKAAIEGRPAPYALDALQALATRCTAHEDAANKVERQVGKSAAALLLASRIGERFRALVTGASDKGTWARLLDVPAEGRVVRGFQGADVGDQVRVRLTGVDVERGFIDFERVDEPGARARDRGSPR